MGCGSSAPLDVLQASRDGDLAAVEKCIKAGLGVNGCDEHGATPLHYAAESGSYDIAQTLLEAGALVEAKSTVRQLALAPRPRWSGAALSRRSRWARQRVLGR